VVRQPKLRSRPAQNAPGMQAPIAPRPDPTPQPQIAEVKPAPEGAPRFCFGGKRLRQHRCGAGPPRAAASNRGGYGDGGTSFTQGRQGGAASSLDVLSDTMGVDFGPLPRAR